MTTDVMKLKELSDDENATLNRLFVQLEARAPRNLIRSSYYEGRRAVKQIGTVIPPQYAKLGMALGWSAKGVDGLGRRCNLEKMVWPDGDLDSLGMRELEDSNFLFSEISQGITDSLLHGVSYLITTRGDVSLGEPAALVHAKDALNATGDWNVRTRKLDNLLSVTDRDREHITGFSLYLRNLTISAVKSGRVWSVTRQEHPYGVPAEPLVYGPRSSRRMGRSRITRAVMSTQDAAIRSLIRLEAHMDIYAISKFIVLGADESIFKNADGSTKTSLQVALGRSFGIPDDDDAATPRADVKQFAAESPEPHLAQLNALAKLMARELDLSDADFALTDMANPTAADAFSEAEKSLLAAAEGATDDYSVPVRRTVARALAIQNDINVIPKEWAGIDTKWRDPKFLSRAAAADAGMKQLSAVPWLAETDVGLELIGLTEQQIKRAIAQKQKATGRAVLDALRAPATPVPADAVTE